MLSEVNGVHFVAVQRKMKKVPELEQVIAMPQHPDISLLTLLLLYVKLTAHQAAEGSEVLIGLVPPYRPIASSTIGTLTASALPQFGIDSSKWGAHATRGSMTQLLNPLELPPEVVAELG